MTTHLPDERQPPLYFAGRRDELGILDAELRALCATGQAPGGLLLVTGVPGVGKTQLATKYLVDTAGKDVEGVAIHAVAVGPGALRDETSLFRTICRALGEKRKGEEIAQIENRLAGGGVGLGGFGVKGRASATMDVGRHTGDLELMLRESRTAGLWDGKALVIVVDELQHADADAIQRLATLHMNINNLPMQLLGFGLQHTPRVLANPPGGHAGISRVRPPLPLGPLSHDDAVDAMAGSLEVIGHLGAAIADESIVALAKASFGFPQHIRGYLEGANSAIDMHGHLEGEALQDALRHGDACRRAYYELRLGAIVHPERLLPLVAHMIATGQDVLDPVSANNAVGNDRDALDAAVAHGVLVQSPTGDLAFGIPSFANYMKGWYRDVEKSRSSMAGSV